MVCAIADVHGTYIGLLLLAWYLAHLPSFPLWPQPAHYSTDPNSDSVLPAWFNKLPTTIQLFVVAVVVAHVLALVIYLYFVAQESRKPAFKKKLT